MGGGGRCPNASPCSWSPSNHKDLLSGPRPRQLLNGTNMSSFQALPSSSLALLSPSPCSDVGKTLIYEAPSPRRPHQGSPSSIPTRSHRTLCKAKCREQGVVGGQFTYCKELNGKQGISRERQLSHQTEEQPSLHPVSGTKTMEGPGDHRRGRGC